MNKLLSLALCATLALSSCAALGNTIDKVGDRTEKIVTHTTGEVRKLKDELRVDIAQLKTETLKEVKDTVEEVVPKVVDKAVERVLGDEAVAFLIVTVTFLLGAVVLTAMLLLLGAARTAYKRWRHPKGCSAR